MKKEVCATALVATTLLSGCSAGSGITEGLGRNNGVSVSGESFLNKADGPAFFEHYLGDKPYLTPEYKPDKNGSITYTNFQLDPTKLPPIDPAVQAKVAHELARIGGVNDKGLLGGSGFLLSSPDHKNTSVITAGHVVNGIVKGQHTAILSVTSGVGLGYDGIDSYFHNTTVAEIVDSPTRDVVTEREEDVAVIHISKDMQLDGEGLELRNLRADPLQFGEQLYLMNYQDKHQTDDPVTYTVLYAGSRAADGKPSRFANVISNITPGVEEDELRRGGSGGPVVDRQGRVVGISVKRNLDLYACQTPIEEGERSIDGKTMETAITVPLSTGECKQGVQEAVIRMVTSDAGFTPNPRVKSFHYVSPW